VKQLEFEEFYQASRDVCLKAVLASVGDRPLAENLVAELFTRAWISWYSVSRHPAPFPRQRVRLCPARSGKGVGDLRKDCAGDREGFTLAGPARRPGIR